MIFLDIETLDFFQDPAIAALPRPQQLAALRFGVAVTCDAETNEWREWHAADLPALWNYLAGRDLCGWNIRAFDLPVIRANLARCHDYPDADVDPLGRVVDLFDDIRQATGRWYKLEVIAQANLGRGKLTDGQQAAEWLRNGDPADIRRAAEYCRQDVALTKELYRILVSGQALRLPPRPERGETEELAFYFLPVPPPTGA